MRRQGCMSERSFKHHRRTGKQDLGKEDKSLVLRASACYKTGRYSLKAINRKRIPTEILEYAAVTGKPEKTFENNCN